MKKINYLPFLVFLVGCSIPRAKRLDSGYIISSSKKFTLKDNSFLLDTSILSIDRPYLLTCSKSTSLKFYRSGRVAYTYTIGLENNIVIMRRAGYYSVNKNNLIIEMTTGSSHGMIGGDEWGFMTIKGQIVGDTLRFYKDQWYGKGKNDGEFTRLKSDCFYLKSNKESMQEEPDW